MKENMKKLLEYIDKNRFKNYPIKNKALQECEEYAKNLYLKMLAVVMHQKKDILAEQHNFFTRIVSGAGVELTVQDYFRQALEIEVEDYQKFVEVFQDNPVKYRFAVDALLLIGMEENSDEQKQLLIGVMEFLKIRKIQVKYLVRLAKSILTQDNEEYDSAEVERPKEIGFELFSEYTMLYANTISNTEEYLYIRSKLQVEFKLENYIIHSQKVHFKNLKIDLTSSLEFQNNEEIVLEDCIFTGNNFSLSFTGVTTIKIVNCKFQNFTNYTLLQIGNQTVEIEDCIFNNCVYKYSRNSDDWLVLGGVIHGEKNTNHTIEGCTFLNCGGSNTKNYYSSAIVCNFRTEVSNSKFVNCWNKNEGTIDPEHARRTLFVSNSINNGNAILNSAHFM